MEKEQIHEMAADLKRKLNTIQNGMNKTFAGLSPEGQEKVSGHQVDLAKAVRAAKNGDAEALYKMSK